MHSRADYTSVSHYAWGGGLPGRYAFTLDQDKLGYIWIGTENGLARFNGYEFKLFTTKDGLPDNEILFLSLDRRNRLWFCPFANTVGYIKDDQIYNSRNDSVLKNLHMTAKAERVLPDRFGNIAIAEKKKVIIITSDNKIKVFDFDTPESRIQTFSMFASPGGEIHVVDFKNQLYRYNNEKWVPSFRMPAQLSTFTCCEVIERLGYEKGLALLQIAAKKKLPYFQDKAEIAQFHSINLLGPNQIGMARSDGYFILDRNTAEVVDTLLYGVSVAVGLIAADSSLWLSTHGDGVYRFISSPVRSLHLKGEPGQEVSFIHAEHNEVYATLEKGKFVKASVSAGNLQAEEIQAVGLKRQDQLFRYLGRNSRGEWVGISNQILVFDGLNQEPRDIGLTSAFKDIMQEDSRHLLTATFMGVQRFDIDEKRYTDTLLQQRATCVTELDGIVYAGGLDGIFYGTRKDNFRRMPNLPQDLQTRILKLSAGTDHVLWAANSTAALIGLKDNKVIARIDEQNGLQCNKINAIRVTQQLILVGTDNGLYILENKSPYRVIRHLNETLGLYSNEISSLDVAGDNIWVGTIAGINYFQQHDLFRKGVAPRLVINSIINDETRITPSEKNMSLHSGPLSIDFDIIDHTGGQKPVLQYRLDGESGWTQIDNSELYFPKVSYGTFTVELKAESPNWAEPQYRTLHFYHPYPFYERWWFLTFVFFALLASTIFLVRRYVKQARRKDEEQAAVQRRLLQLEQMALQGQMNPHFIFNCISAIKQFYNIGDNTKANIFVDQFAALIRQTFEMGSQLFIPLSNEMSYLNHYLSIEKIRFNDSFDFSITTNIQMSAASVYVPVMLLQPLAENSVRHGIRHLSDRRGHISIHVQQNADRVTITVTDNGVGREKSKTFGQFLQHSSSLTSTKVNTKRIELLNELFLRQIDFSTEDITDIKGEVAGTKTTISYPLSIHKRYH
ncbi:hypothetical protein GCM10023092_09400 [Rurimicrobium arvi]|uniref:Signal transduction histidine kinase internal region domain-containing protein n=1 Tax=Rurimicrobium arvi TaxID=2049916 RepID=A0ABP8MM39_9BACT